MLHLHLACYVYMLFPQTIYILWREILQSSNKILLWIYKNLTSGTSHLQYTFAFIYTENIGLQCNFLTSYTKWSERYTVISLITMTTLVWQTYHLVYWLQEMYHLFVWLLFFLLIFWIYFTKQFFSCYMYDLLSLCKILIAGFGSRIRNKHNELFQFMCWFNRN